MGTEPPPSTSATDDSARPRRRRRLSRWGLPWRYAVAIHLAIALTIAGVAAWQVAAFLE